VRGVRFINDSKATNVVSLKAALESLNENAILIMGGRDKGNDYEPVKSLVQKRVNHLILPWQSREIQSSCRLRVPHLICSGIMLNEA